MWLICTAAVSAAPCTGRCDLTAGGSQYLVRNAVYSLTAAKTLDGQISTTFGIVNSAMQNALFSGVRPQGVYFRGGATY
jgi:hypothetical protein